MAQTCFKRLSFLQPDRDENSYAMAQSYIMQRQPQAALEILKSLAPLPKAPGEKVKSYGPAHLAMAKEALAQKQLTPALLDTAQLHLYRAVAWKAEPYTSEAHFILFNVLRLRNQPEQAEQNLITAVSKAGDRIPQWRLVLAQWYANQGKRDQAMAQTERAVKLFRERLEESLDDHNARLPLIEALLFLGDFAGARDVCQQGMALVPGTELGHRYRLILGRILLAMYDAKAADEKKSTPEERFRLLEQVIAINPNDINMLQRLVGFTRQTGSAAEKARKHFDDLINAPGPGAAIAHTMLGMDFWQQGDQKSARYHWEKAHNLSQSQGAGSTWALVTNNLAWLIAIAKPPDLDRALGMIESVLAKDQNPKYHGTRGHILAKMGRHKEAIEDLEKAKVAYPPNSPELYMLYVQLGESYAQIGLPGESERYKRLAEELKKAMSGATASPATAPKDAPADPKAPAAAPEGKVPDAKPPATPAPKP
jgi:tetratricopeptide (TPR) repeat protein